MSLDFRHHHAFWASIIAETLARRGLTRAVICPGSRSSLLAIAFAQNPHIKAIPILDERSAAFFALGLAKQSQHPVILVCTSGTAGANFYPAIIEATESRVPLLVFTADRPPELRHCHAGQTIDQTRLFGVYPRWQVELGLPESDLDRWRYLRQTILQAVLRSQFPVPGVVHLNCPFREPLAPIIDPDFQAQTQNFDENNFFKEITAKTYNPQTILPYLNALLEQWQQEPRGLIIAGVATPANPEAYCLAIAALAEKLQFPVLAEALSPVRNFAAFNPFLISTYDLILRYPPHALALAPKFVIQLGDMPTSKELRQWLAALEPECWLIDDNPDNLDPLHLHCQRLPIALPALVQSLNLNTSQSPKPDFYLKKWQFLEQSLQKVLDKTFADQNALLEAKIARILSQNLPPATQIFVANSMSVRYLEWFWQPGDRQITPYFNRGANGIDGTLSTALGVAHSGYTTGKKTVLLTGDLALLHDSNGFLVNPYFQGHLSIILVNNQGGGIFEQLPISQFEPPFEDFFATPQQVDFAQLAGSHGIEYLCIADWSELIAQVQTLPEQGIRLLEIACDRKADAQWLKQNLPYFAKIAHEMQ
jgi:2-succinyl-5-enolpyruvyl-6-hydroxy-3-cyclohexene-1-carboxylate synthase